ncbi:hypothetical protein WJX73_003407 [Symbiochloris irregularis]|uniref:Carboxypeptidase n=1 Tax=Symbiochloris irregularis TaxID=706552 RepID=A0AAW1P8G7_9CHLO
MFSKLCCAIVAVISTNSVPTHSLPAKLSRPDSALKAPTDVTAFGFLHVGDSGNSSLFYAYYEAQNEDAAAPVILWLQGGPGCASMFGNLYELGPWRVNQSLDLTPNPGSWNRKFGLLFIDQPIGTGFSPKGSRKIPTDELEIATDLYEGLQAFYTKHAELSGRPLFITGESYAGKYVPAAGHLIVQAQAFARGQPLSALRDFPLRARSLGPPLFSLGGLVIGNGLTDPVSQILHAADTAFYMGLIDSQQRILAMARQLEVAQLARLGRWEEAHEKRNALLGYLQRAAGLGTLFDMRRTVDYDHTDAVGRYLNQPAVQEALGIDSRPKFEACSAEVDRALGPDVMRSAVDLIPEILQHLPMLFYQGQFDVQDGPSTQRWLSLLDWPGQQEWNLAPRLLWRPRLDADAVTVPDLQAELHLAEQTDQGRVTWCLTTSLW